MKVFTCSDFTGVYPVGTAAVVVAADEAAARDLMRAQLMQLAKVSRGYVPSDDFTLQELATDLPHVVVLCDGDY